MYAKDRQRFMDGSNQVYACELGRLARELMASTPALIRRLECLFDEILIDEVQDLSGYDWQIVHELLESRIDVRMVGDVRQAVLSTNPRGQKNKQYGYAGALEWFLVQEKGGLLSIDYAITTYRCRTEIATFSDTILIDHGASQEPRHRIKWFLNMMVCTWCIRSMSTNTSNGTYLSVFAAP
ncbi:hypothetical protein PS874_06319 [Pseudomonas fluorescens]|nr:hypothetical protein PS874_06319 [Pseudomonas fluorescens]